MAGLNIKVRTFSDQGLFARKKISLGSKSIETPFKAMSITNTTKNDQIRDEARGFNEIWLNTDPQKLNKAKNTMKSPHTKKIREGLNKSKEGEFNLIFADYKATQEITDENIKFLADMIYSNSDIVPVPLMSKFYDAVRDSNQGTMSKYWSIYKKNTRKFIKAVRQINGKPIMGVLPYLPWSFVQQMVNFYLDEGIRCFAFDFNARTVTSHTQITNMVQPLIREIANRNLQEEVFFYSLNANKGRSSGSRDFVPPKDYLSLGVGFDVLGEKHKSLPMHPDVLAKMDDSKPKFRMFSRENYYYKDFDIESILEKQIPQETGLNRSRVVKRLQTNNNTKYKYQALLNAEQQSMENKVLRTVIDEQRVGEHVKAKTGVTDNQYSVLEQVKNSFDAGKTQKSLKEPDLW